MALIIIGILVLIASFALQKNREYGRFGKVVRGLAVIIMLIGVLMKCIIQVDAGQAGVKSLFGNVQNDVLSTGLHFINPLLKLPGWI